jgi:hypothetical protein
MEWQIVFDALVEASRLSNVAIAEQVNAAGGACSREAVRKWRGGRRPKRRNLIGILTGIPMTVRQRDELVAAWLALRPAVTIYGRPIVVLKIDCVRQIREIYATEADQLRANSGPVKPYDPCDHITMIRINAIALDENRNVIGKFRQLIRPPRHQKYDKIDARIAGLQWKQLRKAPRLEEVIPAFKMWMEAHSYPPLVAWHAGTIATIMQHARFFYPSWVDLSELAKEQWGTGSIDGVAMRLGIDSPPDKMAELMVAVVVALGV